MFNRTAKSIPVSAEMKKLLGIKSDRVPPNMLISHILKAEADLLWVGGIGTYVKAASESHRMSATRPTMASGLTGRVALQSGR